MAKGGWRPNAGRPKGSKDRIKAEISAEAEAKGITPAAVMEKAMLAHYEAGRLDRAATIAKDLAPYVHPRLSNVQHAGLPPTVVVIEDVHWYANAAHAGADDSEGAPPSIAGAPQSLPLQGGGVRSQVG